MDELTIGARTLRLEQGDITRIAVDAIVNAGNSGLLGGGGVDGAIHRAGGPQILEECRKLGGCPPGQARITSGGRLKARYVIHTVGPIYHDGKHGEPQTLANAYRSSLELASQHGIKTLAFPSISTGAYGYPIELAAPIALETAMLYLRSHPEIEIARFVLFGSSAYEVYERATRDVCQRLHINSV